MDDNPQVQSVGRATSGHGRHAHGHAAPDTLGPRLLAGVFINLAIFFLELVGGVLANSLGLISDAAHNLSDVVALLLSYGANRLGKRPPTPSRTFAFRRVEVLVAFLNAATLIAVAAFVMFEGVKRLLNPTPVGGATVMLVAGIGMFANAAAAWLLRDHDDLNAKSAFLHLVADAVHSLGVVIGGALVWAFHFNAADAIVSIVLSIWMAKESWNIVVSSVNILLESTPDDVDFWEVVEAMEASEGVIDVHALHVWAIASNEFALSAHVVVGDEPLSDLVEVTRRIKEMLSSQFGITHPTLEVECESTGCAGGLCEVDMLEKRPKVLGTTVSSGLTS